MSKWQETIGAGFGTGRNKGTTRRLGVVDQRDGSEAGHHVEHWDGSQDAVVKVKPITLTAKVQRMEAP